MNQRTIFVRVLLRHVAMLVFLGVWVVLSSLIFSAWLVVTGDGIPQAIVSLGLIVGNIVLMWQLAKRFRGVLNTYYPLNPPPIRPSE